MANKKISALTSASTPLAGTEVLPIVQSSTTVKATIANIVGAGTSPGSFTTLSASGDTTVTSSTATTLNLNLTNTKAAGQGDAYFNITKAANGNSNGVQLLTGASQKWVVGTGITAVNDNFKIYNANTSAIALEIPVAGTNVTLNTGNLVIGTSGQGIDFSATPGTGTSELFADYEEGTWTPTISFGGASVGITYSFQQGSYTKVGRLVTATCVVNLSAKGSSTGTAYIEGLPYAANATYYAVGVIRIGAITCSGPVAVNTTPSATNLLYTTTSLLGVISVMTEANFSNTSATMMTISYIV
jgi:hypothetical protein